MIVRVFSQASCFALLLAAALPAQAEEPVSIGKFMDWEGYQYKEGATAKEPATKVCYAVTQPKSSDSTKKVKRDPVFLIVTNKPQRKIKGEVTTVIGYPFKEKSKVELKIDAEMFELYTVGDGAWAGDSETEKKIIGKMKIAKKLSLKGTSWKGTTTTDHYSLSGFSAVLDAINSTCASK